MDLLPVEEIYSWQLDKFFFRIPQIENGIINFEIGTEKQQVKYEALDITDVVGDLLAALNPLLRNTKEDGAGGGYKASDYIAQVLHDTDNGIYLWTFVYSDGLLQIGIWKTWNVDFLEDLADQHFDTAKYEALKQKPAKDLMHGLKFAVAMRPDHFVVPLLEAVEMLRTKHSESEYQAHCAFAFPVQETAALKQWLDEEWKPE